MFAKLKGGSSIRLQDGTEIRPDQVLEEAVPGRYVAVACCIESSEQNTLKELLDHAMFSR
jgi:hypothetical protein